MKIELLTVHGKINIYKNKKNIPCFNIVAVGGTKMKINVHREPFVYFNNFINNYHNAQEF